jgi:ribosomal protein S18 acetylase RimI-like enzyme
VLKEFHGSGAGAGLMKVALELAKTEGVEHLWLDTHINNARGIRFYEKHGFKICGRHYFTIGTQTFEYHLMDIELSPNPWPVEKKRMKPETSLSNL